MMFEAKVQINTVDEYNLFSLFMSNLVEMRKEKPLPTREQIKKALDDQYGKPEPKSEPVKDEAIVGSIGTPDATITDAKLIDAFTKYAPGKNAAVLKELLAKYGATRVAGIAQKRRAEFLAEIGG